MTTIYLIVHKVRPNVREYYAHKTRESAQAHMKALRLEFDEEITIGNQSIYLEVIDLEE